MILNMQILPEGHSTLTGTTDLESVKADLPTFLEDISYTAEIDRMGATACAHITFKGKLELECSRCLNSFPLVFNGDFRLVIKEGTGSCGMQSDSDGVDFYYDSRHELVDISPVFFDEIMLSIPLKPLCSEFCKGIEINGLKNISVFNDADRQEQKAIDPRWDALKKIKLSNQ
ncbi:MAG TPA: DUF177 domain-containing protein [Chitinispirillaceae bacterium]|nr:DUF177 domain-containing protein [Chitinispirillaceae bacterium]